MWASHLARSSQHGPRGDSVYDLARSLVATALSTCCALWLLTVAVARLHLFHNAYIHHLQTIEDERWLLAQCHDPAFFANLRQHTVICHEAKENARRTPVLVALNATLSASSLCGSVACTEIIAYVRGGGVALVAAACIGSIALVAIILPAANIISRWMRQQASRSIGGDAMEVAIPAVYEQECWLQSVGERGMWDQRGVPMYPDAAVKKTV